MSNESVIEHAGTTENAAPTTNARKPPKRLFSAGLGTAESPLRFVVANGAAEAQTALGTFSVRSAATHELKQFWAENKLNDLTNAEIARKLNVTTPTVGNWIARLGAAEYSQGSSRRDLALEDLRAGKEVAEIAKARGFTITAVYRLAKRFGIQYARAENKGKAARFTTEQFVEAAAGKTWDQLAKAMKISVGTARNYASRKDLTERLRAVMVMGKRGPAKGSKKQGGRRGDATLADTLRGVDYGTVRLLLQTMAVVGAFRDGTEVTALVEQFGVPEPVVRYWTAFGDVRGAGDRG